MVTPSLHQEARLQSQQSNQAIQKLTDRQQDKLQAKLGLHWDIQWVPQGCKMELNLLQKQGNKEKKLRSLLQLGNKQRPAHGDSCWQYVFVIVNIVMEQKQR